MLCWLGEFWIKVDTGWNITKNIVFFFSDYCAAPDFHPNQKKHMHVKQQTFAYSEDMTRSLNKANNGHIAGCKQWIKLTSPFDNTLSTLSSLPTLSSQTAGIFLNNKSSAWESYQSTMLPQVPFSNLEDYVCRICAAPLLHYLHLPHSEILQWLTKAETPSTKTMWWWTKKNISYRNTEIHLRCIF